MPSLRLMLPLSLLLMLMPMLLCTDTHMDTIPVSTLATGIPPTLPMPIPMPTGMVASPIPTIIMARGLLTLMPMVSMDITTDTGPMAMDTDMEDTEDIMDILIDTT